MKSTTNTLNTIKVSTADHFLRLNRRLKARCDQYPSKHRLIDLDGWYQEATMTAGHRYKIAHELSPERPFWPHSLMPYLTPADWHSFSPELRRTVEKRGAMAYLHITDAIEPRQVEPVCDLLAAGGRGSISGLYIPTDQQSLLDQVRTDEALHKAISSDLKMQTGIEPDFTPQYEESLQAVLVWAGQNGLDPELALVIFVCITERSITKFLSYATKKETVYDPGLKASIIAHARDEARHHQIFSDVFRLVFMQLKPAWRGRYGELIPLFLRAFLEPDRNAARFAMAGLFSETEIEERISRVYSPKRVSEGVVQDGKSVITLVKETGLLALSEVREAFQKAGLGAAIL